MGPQLGLMPPGLKCGPLLGIWYVLGIWGLGDESSILQDLLFWLLKAGFKLSSGTVLWYGSTCGTDFDNSETANPSTQGPDCREEKTVRLVRDSCPLP